jgi:hypothetical protein
VTELEQYQPAAAVVAALPPGASNVRAWVETYQFAVEFAAAVVDTPFVPDSYRPRIPDRATDAQRYAAREIAIATAATAIVYGAGIGFDNPVQALQNVYVVKGRPALYADAMVAVVQAAGHEFWVEEVTDSRAVVCGRRAGGREERVTITMDQARKAGWTQRNDNYAKDPQAMLYARAAGRLCKRIAQAELKGFVAMEEAIDGDDDAMNAVPPAPNLVTRTALPAGETSDEQPAAPAAAAKPAAKTAASRTRKKTAAAARPTGEAGPPPLPGEDTTAPAAAAATPAAAPPLPGEGDARPTPEQLTAMDTGFAELEITGVARRDYVAKVIGRQVGHPNELTAADVAKVVEALQAPAFDPDDQDDPGSDADGYDEEPQQDPQQETLG